MIRYISTGNSNAIFSLKEAVVSGLAPGGGLFMPEVIPRLQARDLNRMAGTGFSFMASEVLYPFLKEFFSMQQVEEICSEAFNFELPVVMLNEKIGILELFHGPTLAFKDFGARFLARLIGRLNSDEKEITVLVATSGDTGGAVANGFLNIPGIRVVVLYPGGRVSPFQESQFASLGRNINCIRVNGSFDNCQDMVKSAFRDGDLRKKINLTSANSINIGRWIPQSTYYFSACFDWLKEHPDRPPVFSVPTGNCGNIAAGVLAYRMGLPVKMFIAASNRNNTIPRYLRSGIYKPAASVETIANAMDVGAPSNFERLKALETDGSLLTSIMAGYEFIDHEIVEGMERVYETFGYLMDPHTATGFLALEKSGECGIALATAHPGKFREVLPPGLKDKAVLPLSFSKMETGSLSYVKMDPGYSNLKEYLLRN